MTVTAMPPAAAGADAQEQPKGGRKKKLVIGVVLLAIVAGAGWFFFLKPSEPQEPVAGEVVTLESIQLNLAGGHYLRLGLALQLVEGAHDADGSKALDAAISTFSGLEMAEVARPEQREKLRGQLLLQLEEAYHGDVMGVYFTEFVTQ